MEKSNNHDQPPKPIYDDCSKCETRYPLTSHNAAFYHYEKQPECDFVIMVCPTCDYHCKMFITQDTLDRARQLDFTIINDDGYADENIYSDFLTAYGIELPQTYEVTDRQEALIRRFGETLLNMPDELIWDGIESDHNHPYPERWID